MEYDYTWAMCDEDRPLVAQLERNLKDAREGITNHERGVSPKLPETLSACTDYGFPHDQSDVNYAKQVNEQTKEAIVFDRPAFREDFKRGRVWAQDSRAHEQIMRQKSIDGLLAMHDQALEAESKLANKAMNIQVGTDFIQATIEFPFRVCALGIVMVCHAICDKPMPSPSFYLFPGRCVERSVLYRTGLFGPFFRRINRLGHKFSTGCKCSR
jgi:hypothetical protein